jgi:hypothetical protein
MRLRQAQVVAHLESTRGSATTISGKGGAVLRLYSDVARRMVIENPWTDI